MCLVQLIYTVADALGTSDHPYHFMQLLYYHITVIPQWIFCFIIQIWKVFLREVALHLFYLIISCYLLQPADSGVIGA